MVIREEGEAETISCTLSLRCHPHGSTCGSTHGWRLLVIWNQDRSLVGIVASAVDRRYLRVSVHGCNNSDRLGITDTVV